jgi:hypothetical protein
VPRVDDASRFLNYQRRHAQAALNSDDVIGTLPRHTGESPQFLLILHMAS